MILLAKQDKITEFITNHYALLIVFCLVVHLYVSSWHLVFSHYDWNNNYCLVHFLIFHFLFILMFSSLLSVVIRGPGHPPFPFDPRIYDSSFTLAQLESSKSTQSYLRHNYSSTIRFCPTCQNFKPLRTHHCSTCKSCSLKMDHHCPWISSCIGFQNHKSYILLLFYHILLSSISLPSFLLSLPFFQSSSEYLVCFFNVVCLIGSEIGAGFILYKHWGLVLENKTSVEVWEAVWGKDDGEKEGKEYVFPWDRGSRKRNFEAMFGESVVLWFLPTSSSGDGIRFEKNGEGRVEERVEDEVGSLVGENADL
eukprot:TRINITY_DN19919_c0_g1_i1.p1 TRINITY_DN19919_c0_g1~~TRINITY_DN19919_c0_g1_i1.p1  ORF type:complete len:309 (-),score=38.01 TRINITY_DN19919_c0_g1_i1:324-1250(-)